MNGNFYHNLRFRYTSSHVCKKEAIVNLVPSNSVEFLRYANKKKMLTLFFK